MAGWTGYFTGKGDAPSRLQRMVQQGWQQNRMIYRGDQWFRPRPGAGFSSGRLEVLSEGARGRRRDTFNRLRQMTDGRVSTLTASRPPYEVIPKTRDQHVLDAARQAKKLIAAKWDESGWNVGGTMRELVLTGEIDGVSFLNVTFDPTCGGRSKGSGWARLFGESFVLAPSQLTLLLFIGRTQTGLLSPVFCLRRRSRQITE
jgi:hypothetical protein